VTIRILKLELTVEGIRGGFFAGKQQKKKKKRVAGWTQQEKLGDCAIQRGRRVKEEAARVRGDDCPVGELVPPAEKSPRQK